MKEQLDPTLIMQTATAFWAFKAMFTALNFNVAQHAD